MMERCHFNAFLNEAVNIQTSIAGHDVSDLSMYEIMYRSNFNNYVNDAKQIQNDAVRKKVVIEYLASNIITTANPKQNCQNVAALAGDSTGIRNVCGNYYYSPMNTMQPVQRNIDSTLQHHLNINLESTNSVCATFVRHDVDSSQAIISRNASVMDCYVLLEKITISKYQKSLRQPSVLLKQISWRQMQTVMPECKVHLSDECFHVL